METDLELGDKISKRSHFNVVEKGLLLDLVQVYKEVIENKKTGKNIVLHSVKH